MEGTEETTEGRPLAGAALKSALEKERKDRKELDKQVKELRARLDAADQAAEKAKRAQADEDKSEMDKVLDRLARVEAERDQERTARESAEQERERVDRVRRHAGEFDNADDVVALLRGRGDLGDVESDEDAQRVLAELKRDRPNLLKQEAGLSGMEQVLRDGQSVASSIAVPEPAGVTPEQLVQMNPDQLAQFKATNPDAYWRALDETGRVQTSASRVAHVAVK
jgi:chromosome segregation ATPase